MNKLQIGVIGSMADVNIATSLKEIAKELGKEIAKRHAIVVFGFEGDFDSLSLCAAKEAQKVGGQTLAFIWGSKNFNLDTLNSIKVITGQQRGGGREFSFILSCDAVISINGGSGTLMEITMAYQASIPIVVMNSSGGWSEKLQNQFLDERKKILITSAKTAKEAVQKCFLRQNA